MAGKKIENYGPGEAEDGYGGEADLHEHLEGCEKNPGDLKYGTVDRCKVEMGHLTPDNYDNDLVDIQGLNVRCKRSMTFPGTDMPSAGNDKLETVIMSSSDNPLYTMARKEIENYGQNKMDRFEEMVHQKPTFWCGKNKISFDISKNKKLKNLDPLDGEDVLQPLNRVPQESPFRRNNFGSCKQKWRTWLPFTASLFSCTATLGTLIYAIVVIRRGDFVMETEAVMKSIQYSYPEVCIDCQKLVKNPYKMNERDSFLDDLTKKQEDGIIMCCAHNTSQMSSLLEAIMREQETESDVDDVELSSVSAHKAMRAESGEEINSNAYLQDILRFEPYYHDSRREHVDGIMVLKDGFVIQHSGIYFIYCSVAYRLDSPQTDKKDPREYLFSSIYRTRPNSAADTGVLLMSVHTKCKNCGKENESSFTGGSFYLKAGDFIQVLVSEREFVDFDRESTYMGLVLLGEKVA